MSAKALRKKKKNTVSWIVNTKPGDFASKANLSKKQNNGSVNRDCNLRYK